MKQITLTIEDDKFDFFLELVQCLDFVQVSEIHYLGDSKEEILKNIQEGLKELKAIEKGERVTISARDFLNSL